jgi:hypothetical protein
MKKVLLSGILVLLIGLVTKINAQCELGYSRWNLIGLDSASTIFNGNQSLTRFVVDIEFDIKYSDNVKVIYVHTFLEQDFKGFFDCDNPASNPAPTSTVLGTGWDQVGMSIYDLAIDNSTPRGPEGVAVPVSLKESYGPDPSVELTSARNSTNIIVTKTYSGSNNTDHFVIQNMVVYVNNYNANELNTRSIVWANDGSTNLPQCTLCPQPVSINAPSISGKNSCQNFSFTITSTNPEMRTVNCDVYIDFNKNGINDGSDLLVKTLSASFSGSQPFSSGAQSYSVNTTISDPLVIRVQGSNYGPYYGVTTYDSAVACGTLPVHFRSFTAIRNKQRKEQVQLKWETEKEQNNRGFYVQSRTADEWKNVAFITSKAADGNSNSILSYEYIDVNTIKGVTQYRLMQVDLDEKSSYSEVKAVLGKELGSTVLVYPNPSLNGTVNIIFNNQKSINEVIVSDITGRIVKYYPHVSNNNLTIEGLISGFYTIKVTDRSTSVSSVEKVVVK